MTTRTRPPWQRFTIATLLLLIFCSAGAFVGFRFGLTEGVEAQVEKRLADQISVVYPKTYRVTDLLTDVDSKQIKQSALAELVDEIEKSTVHSRWAKQDGPCTIAAMPPDCLVVSASSSDHDQVLAYLEGRRKGRQKPARR